MVGNSGGGGFCGFVVFGYKTSTTTITTTISLLFNYVTTTLAISMLSNCYHHHEMRKILRYLFWHAMAMSAVHIGIGMNVVKWKI